jgi:hypothetical protein
MFSYDPEEFIDIYGDLDREIRLGRDVETVPNESKLPGPYLGKGRAFFGKLDSTRNSLWGGGGFFISEASGMVKDVVRVVMDMSEGLVKQFHGLYGGLGTADGVLSAVGIETWIEGTDDLENVLTEQELLALGMVVDRCRHEIFCKNASF